ERSPTKCVSPASVASSAKSVAAISISREMTFEESKRTFARELRRGGRVVARVDVAIKRVPGIGIAEDLDAAFRDRAGVAVAMPLHGRGRDRRILLAEMELYRRLEWLLEELHVARAVVAHSGQAEPDRGQQRDRAAPAIADDADPAGRRDRFRGRGDVRDGAVHADLADENLAARRRTLGVFEFDAGFDMIEERRCDRGEAACCETIDRTAHPRVDPENLLRADDAAAHRRLRARN